MGGYVSAVKELLDLPINNSQKRILFDTLYSVYDQPLHNQKLYREIKDQYQTILKKFNYQNRLHALNHTTGQYSKIKNGRRSWPGTQVLTRQGVKSHFLLILEQQAEAIDHLFHSNALQKYLKPSNLGLSILIPLLSFPDFLRHSALILKHIATNKAGRFDYLKKYGTKWFNELIKMTMSTITLGISSGWYLSHLSAALGPGGIFLSLGLSGLKTLNTAVADYLKLKKFDATLSCLELKIETLGREIQAINGLEQEKVKRQKLKDYIELKERVVLKRNYLKQKSVTELFTGMLLVSGLALTLCSPVIGTGMMLLVFALQYGLKHRYLPKKAIEFSYNPKVQLHKTLHQHVIDQISRLSSIKNPTERHIEKSDFYEQCKAALEDCDNDLKSLQNTEQLLYALSMIIEASGKRRKTNDTIPISQKKLQSDLKKFLTPWREGFPEQTEFHTLISALMQSSKHSHRQIRQHENRHDGLMFYRHEQIYDDAFLVENR